MDFNIKSSTEKLSVAEFTGKFGVSVEDEKY